MKKILVYLILLLSINASAQIVIKENQYPASVLGTDTVKLTVIGSAFPSLAPIFGGAIDMTAASDSVPLFYDHRLPTASYEFADSNDYILFRYPYKGNIQSSIVASGILEYGMNIFDTSYSTFTLTAGATDSIFIPAQTIIYSSPRVKIPFLATYGDTWSSAYTYDLGFELSTTFPPLLHAPCTVRSYITETSNVVGWGQMRVNDINGLPGMYLDILQIQTRRIKRDSFFLGSSLLPGTLLTIFAVYQGKADTVYEQRYQRQGEVTPLTTISFRDAAYMQPIGARTHVQRLLPFVDGVNDVTNNRPCVYPNPVYGHTLNLQLHPGIYNYQLYDITGKPEATGQVIVAGRPGEINLPGDIVNGWYYLHINGNGGSRTIPVQISR